MYRIPHILGVLIGERTGFLSYGGGGVPPPPPPPPWINPRCECKCYSLAIQTSLSLCKSLTSGEMKGCVFADELTDLNVDELTDLNVS